MPPRGCGRPRRCVVGVWLDAGAMFLGGSVRPVDTPCCGATTDSLLHRTLLRKGASEFGNWKGVELDWAETQDSGPGALKGPPKGFRRPGSPGGLGSAHRLSPQPRPRVGLPASLPGPRPLWGLSFLLDSQY